MTAYAVPVVALVNITSRNSLSICALVSLPFCLVSNLLNIVCSAQSVINTSTSEKVVHVSYSVCRALSCGSGAVLVCVAHGNSTS
jgi:hypothetical protein